MISMFSFSTQTRGKHLKYLYNVDKNYSEGESCLSDTTPLPAATFMRIIAPLYTLHF